VLGIDWDGERMFLVIILNFVQSLLDFCMYILRTISRRCLYIAILYFDYIVYDTSL